MTTTDEDEGIRAIRDVRKRISEEYGNSPTKLVGHYVVQQESYGKRVRQSGATQQADAVNRLSADR